MRKLWAGINSIIAQKTCTYSSIDKIKDVNGKLVSDPAQISSIFNEYSINVTDDINKTNPRTAKSPLRYLGSANENSLSLSPVTHFEVEDIIANLNSSKLTSPHSVPIKLLKILKHHISHPLAELVNQSFLKGVFPSNLKVAKVVSVLKREISKLCPITGQFHYCQFLVKYLKIKCIKALFICCLQ